MRVAESLATAASTAAINSGSGGSGMYSLAPAWIAATAARASLEMPQPRSAHGCARPRAASPDRGYRGRTSTSIRSAPLPPRSTAMACSVVSAWVHRSAVVHRDLGGRGELALQCANDEKPHHNLLFVCSRRLCACRQKTFVAFRLDDFRHGPRQSLSSTSTTSPRATSRLFDVNVDRFADATVEFEPRCRGRASTARRRPSWSGRAPPRPAPVRRNTASRSAAIVRPCSSSL